MCSGSGAGSYLRLIDFLYHSTLGLRVIKKKKKRRLGILIPRIAEVEEKVSAYISCLGGDRVHLFEIESSRMFESRQ